MRVSTGERLRTFGKAAGAFFLTGAGTACGGDGSTGPTPEPVPEASRVAFVGREAGRPALWVQDAEGSNRVRIRFAGAVEMPGNTLPMPPVEDDHILAIGPVSWSPDGQRLAVVLTLAYDQSEVVVVEADGSNARVASLNTQIIMTRADWSPDGTRLVYGMSTLPGAAGVQLFVTDLVQNGWRQLTKGAPVGSAATAPRWDSAGTAVYLTEALLQAPPSDEWRSRISRVDAGTGVVEVLVENVTGTVQDVARDGSWALVLRLVSTSPQADPVRELVRLPLAGGVPEVRLTLGNLLLGRISPDDRLVGFVADQAPDPLGTRYAAATLPASGGDPVPVGGWDPESYSLDVR